MSLRIFPDLESLSHAAAESFVRRCRDAIAAKGVFQVALAGGSTPKRLYEFLSEPPYRDFIEWPRVHAFFGDERFVPPTDPQSNEGQARAALLNQVPIPEQNIFPMFVPGEIQTVVNAYETVLRSRAPNGLDMVLLGMGDDGHTASLFPGIPELEEVDRWVAATVSPKGVPQRITLTIPAIALARDLLFLVAGHDKHLELANALDPATPAPPPSGLVARAAKRVEWYVDQAAAGSLVE